MMVQKGILYMIVLLMIILTKDYVWMYNGIVNGIFNIP